MQSLDELVSGVRNLVSLPDTGLKVSEMLADESASAKDVAFIIERDPALTAAVLRMANSAMISQGNEVDSVSRAIARLGSEQTAELAMGISVARSFSGLSSDRMTVERFWRHSVYCAGASRLLAYLLKLPDRDTAFSAGLLHDIGELVIFSCMPEAAAEIMDIAERDNYPAENKCAIERQVLGYDHTDVGQALAEHWNLPQNICLCIGNHHEPMWLQHRPKMVLVVHAANSMAHMLQLGTENIADAPKISEEAWTELNLDPMDMPELLLTLQAFSSDLYKIIASSV